MAQIVGTPLADILNDTAQDDALFGGAGDDTLRSTAGYDSLTGGDGADILDARANADPVALSTAAYYGTTTLDDGTEIDTAWFGPGGGLCYAGFGDTVVGTTASEWVALSLGGATAGVTLDLRLLGTDTPIANGGGALIAIDIVPLVAGSAFGDTIFANTPVGLFNYSTIEGRGGNDTLIGSDGSERLSGGAGADDLSGGGGSDWVQSAEFDLQSPRDTGLEVDRVAGGDGDDFLACGVGDTALGGAGRDGLTLDLSTAQQAVTFDMRQFARAEGVHVLGGLIAGIEVLRELYLPDAPVGTANRVTLIPGHEPGFQNGIVQGGAGVDIVYGSATNDSIAGGAGNDRLFGGGGNDMIDGGDGNDIMTGGAGIDGFDGGVGRDCVRYADALTAVIVDLAAGRATVAPGQQEWLIAIEDCLGSGFDDRLAGSDVANRLMGGAGADVLRGLGGNDRLDGGTGADTLIGGAGSDVLHGGAGADRFVFDTLPLRPTLFDRVLDFTSGEDTLLFDAAAFGALTAGSGGALAAGQLAAGTVATDPATRLLYDAGTGALRYDADGSGEDKAVLVAVLAGAPQLEAGDILVV